ncbi:MAG TPA: M48 family metallopeptidase [Methanobacterium sp.]|nr:M48 family metallopeptidase [Methanobacterium sp.]
MKKSVEINDLRVEYEIIPRKVKYWRLEIKDEKLVLIAPSKHVDHEKIIEKHKNWIYKKFKEINKKKNCAKRINLDFDLSDNEFRDLVKDFVQKFSLELNVNVNKVYFKKMKSRWGSCSAKKNISINVYLKYLPENLIEYVVFHEIAHLVELNHSKKFWDIISAKFENYKNLENELSIYWLAVKTL